MMKIIIFIYLFSSLLFPQSWNDDEGFKSIFVIKQMLKSIQDYRNNISELDSLERIGLVKIQGLAGDSITVLALRRYDPSTGFGFHRIRTKYHLKIDEIKNEISKMYKEYRLEFIRQAARSNSKLKVER